MRQFSYLWPLVPFGMRCKDMQEILIMQEFRQEKSQIKQNILLYLDNMKISEYKFYKESGITRGILRQNNGISEENIARFLAYAPDVDAHWLLTGKGEMLKTKHTSRQNSDASIPILTYKDTKYQEISNTIREKNLYTRPRIPFDAAAGSLSIALGSVADSDCEQFPVIPTFPHYDFTIVARGDSMTPDFLSGDELACSFVHESRFIQWGRPHVLDTAQGVVLKRIFDQSESILCRSINTTYPDFAIPKDEIFHMAIVVGLIRHF